MAILFLVTVSIFGLVNFNNHQIRDDLSTATSTPPGNNQSNSTTASNRLDKDKEVEKIITVLNSAKISNKEALRLSDQESYNSYKEAKYLTQKSQSADLESVKLSENDKEIRIWKIETFFSEITKGYIFTFLDGHWQGMSIVDVGKKGNFKKIFFEEPLSGWQNWETFVENEINPAKIENSSSQASGTDGSVIVIEVKFGQKYAKNIFYDPSLTENTVGNIFRKIKSEFYNNKLSTRQK